MGKRDKDRKGRRFQRPEGDPITREAQERKAKRRRKEFWRDL